ncbi:FAD-dependent oxidoreductase [Arcticibacter eurypsychrophilus]|uniref:FAD-dependent oxidoreductase n=1 Tax=Arcticibacter eurypsychrophilus TaxID=1434752 RepID=UPI00084D4F8D|nr:FAD-dependent oxidoreductase [Arcticibacter eurypsychrophilus]
MKYVIIGAVAGGATTAARLRRMDEHAEIVIFEKGQYISYANCGLPYYIGDVIKDRNKLFVQTATSFTQRFKVDVRISTKVTDINAEQKTITAIQLETGREYQESYDKLVLSPGAFPVRPPLPGINMEGIFTVRNVTDTDYIKNYISQFNVKKAVVVGAGFIGLEMAENFHELGLDVAVVEMGDQILAPVDFPIAAIAQQHLRDKGIHLYLNTAVQGFTKEGDRLRVQLKDEVDLDADLVILSIGVKPDTSLAVKAGIKLGDAKGILVNEYLQTSDPDIYAVGDAIEFPNPISGQATITYLAGPANKQGRICADNLVFGNQHIYKGSINTAIVKVFDLTIGVAGMAAKQLKAQGIEHVVSTIHSNSHAGYYPGAKRMTIQIAFSPDNGRLLSAQVIGEEGVDKRLDLLATVIKNKGAITDLTEIEHAYAPPFSSAKDPVNMAGYVAENILLGRLKIIQCEEIADADESTAILDVRTLAEHAAGTIPGSILIPLDEIRDRLNEIPRDRTLYVFCQQGLRGYLAQRILVQSGFDSVYNLSGGYLLWKSYSDEIALHKKEVLV